jgi:hypothetical protein
MQKYRKFSQKEHVPAFGARKRKLTFLMEPENVQ